MASQLTWTPAPIAIFLTLQPLIDCHGYSHVLKSVLAQDRWLGHQRESLTGFYASKLPSTN